MRTSVLVAPAAVAAVVLAAVLAAAVPRTARGDGDAPPAPGAAASPGLKPGEVLFRPAEGTKLVFDERVAFLSSNKAGRRKWEARGESAGTVEMTVGPFRDGATEVVWRRGDVKGEVVATDKPKDAFDTATDAPDPARASWMLMSRAKQSVTFHVRPDGRIVEMDELLRAQKDVFGAAAGDRPAQNAYYAQWQALAALREVALLCPLPPKRMGAGVTFEDEALPALNGIQSQRLRRTTTLARIDDLRVVLESKGALTDLDPANAPGRSKKSKDGPKIAPRPLKSSGYAAASEVERQSGLLDHGSLRLTWDLSVQFGVDGESVDGTATFAWETILTRRPPDAAPGGAPDANPPGPPGPPPDAPK